jgi:hypothetical protein
MSATIVAEEHPSGLFTLYRVARTFSREELVNLACQLDQENTVAKKSTSSLTAAAKALGSRGGKKGGPARAASLTQAQRTEIARKGGKAKAAAKKK